MLGSQTKEKKNTQSQVEPRRAQTVHAIMRSSRDGFAFARAFSKRKSPSNGDRKMQKTMILAAALGAVALGVPATANAAAPGGAALPGVSSGQSLVQDVHRVRICEVRRGNRHCWWKSHRHNKRWHWRKNRKGVRVRIFL